MSGPQTESDPCVVVTGASSGIGKACALRLDALGYRVFAGVRRDQDGQALRAEASDRLTPVSLDVTEAAGIAGAAESIGEATTGLGLAGLVNNAGIAVIGPVEFVPLADLRRQLEINVVGQVAVTQALLPLLRKGNGRIVNISSISGRIALPLFGPYAASKFALEALSDSLRRELRPWGIRVALIEPGVVDTPIWAKSEAAAATMFDNMGDEARRLYGPVVAATQRAVDNAKRKALTPDAVAQAVIHALTAKRPKTRYVLGSDARRPAVAARLLPDWLVDRIIALVMGVSAREESPGSA